MAKAFMRTESFSVNRGGVVKYIEKNSIFLLTALSIYFIILTYMNLDQSNSYSHKTATGSLGGLTDFSSKEVSRLETAFQNIGIQVSLLNEKATNIENLFGEFLTQQPYTDKKDNGDQSPLTFFDGRVTELHKQLSDLNHRLQYIIDRALV